MVKFKFFVHCSGWANGGYENTHFAESKGQAKKAIAKRNAHYEESGVDCRLSLISIEEISDADFAEDFVGII